MLRAKRSSRLWRALSSPVRRRILDKLRDGPKTTGQLATAFPKLSRFAVMQHLGVLFDAKLVLVRREGRFRFNYLNAVPLTEMYERWVSQYAAPLAKASLGLKRFVERKPITPEMREFVMIMRPSRATFLEDATEAERAKVAEHFEYLKRLRDEGVVIFAGRCTDATLGIAVFRAPDEKGSEALVANDPAVRAGVFVAAIHEFRVALTGKWE